MKKVTKISLLLLLLAVTVVCKANNIRINITSFDAVTNTLQVSLGWDNSWRDQTGNFRDAAWVFVKYKDVTDATWKHGVLVAPAGTNAIVSDTLSGSNVKFEILGKNANTSPAGSRGLIVRRQNNPVGTSASLPEYTGVYNVAMKVNLKLSLPTGTVLVNPEFKVFALEMVDIPAGSFYAGDGGPNSYVSSSTTASIPLNVTSEAIASYVHYEGGSPATVTVPAAFPKGFSEFFIMKYELSNDAYAQFLNTLTRDQQNNLVTGWASVSASSDYAGGFPDNYYHTGAPGIHGLVASSTSPGYFWATTPNHPVVNSSDSYVKNLAYLDWSGMRSMTAFEYEKACRGKGTPVIDEWAWGTSSNTYIGFGVGTITDQNGPGETINEYLEGPITIERFFRCGAFAKDAASTRTNSGGTFYGVMDMSNNMLEVTAGYGDAPGTTFNGTMGDGYISSTGTADVASWSGIATFYKGSQEVSTPVEGRVSSRASFGQPGIRGVIR